MKLAFIQNLGRREKLIIGGSIIGMALLYIIINRAAKQAMLNKIYKAIDSGVNYSGDVNDARFMKAFDAKYWRTVPSGTKLLSVSKSDEITRKIYSNLGSGLSNQSTIKATDTLNLFYNEITNQAQVSQLTYKFSNQNIDFFDYLKRLDWTLSVAGITLWGSSSTDDFDKLIAYIQSLPTN